MKKDLEQAQILLEAAQRDISALAGMDDESSLLLRFNFVILLPTRMRHP